MPNEPKDTSAAATEDSLMALLLGDAGDDKGKKGAESDDEEEEITDGEEADGEGESEEESEDESEEEEEEEEGEEGKDDDDEPVTVSADTVVFTIREGDKEIPVNAEEAEAGYMRQAAFTQKTTELAEDRKTIQAERLQLTDALSQVLAAMDGEDAESTPAKLAELARTDPEAATKLKFERDARAEARKQVQDAKKALDDRTAKEQKDEAAKVKEAEFGKLLAAIPEIGDPAKATKVLTRMTEAAISVGFAAEDMNRITDHRLMKLLKLAADGLRLTAKKPPVPEPKGTKVRSLEPGRTKPGSAQRAQGDADKRFKASRSVDDATDSLMAAMTAAARGKRK